MYPIEETDGCFVTKRGGGLRTYQTELSKSILLIKSLDGCSWYEMGFFFWFSLINTRDSPIFSPPQLLEHEGVLYPDLNHLHRIAALASKKCSLAVDSCDIDLVLAEVAGSLESLGTQHRALSSALELCTVYARTPDKFCDAMRMAYAKNLVDCGFMDLVEKHEQALNSMIRHEEDRRFNYVSLRLMRETCMLRDGALLLERPQFVWLRAAVQMHRDNLDQVKTVYELMATFKMVPSVSMLASSGSNDRSAGFSYLISPDGTIEALFSCLGNVIQLARDGGRVGLGLQKVLSEGAVVKGVRQLGSVSFLDTLNSSLALTGRSPQDLAGGITVYFELWHADIERVLNALHSNKWTLGTTRRFKVGLVVNDLFLERVRDERPWSLLCPSRAPLLASMDGAEFAEEYMRLEDAGVCSKVVDARSLWKTIVEKQLGTGEPSILFKEAMRGKSIHGPAGPITLSSSCAGLVQHTDDLLPSACPTLSIVLPSFVTEDGKLDKDELERVTRQAVRTLNDAIDCASFPFLGNSLSVKNYRALGIGFLGFADLLAILKLPYDSDDARRLNILIAETIQYYALDQSASLASSRGSYSKFDQSKSSRGTLQVDLWSQRAVSGLYDWDALRLKVTAGVFNASVTAEVSNSDVSQLVGCSASSEPFRSLISAVEISSKLYVVIPHHLIATFERAGLWNASLRDRIVSKGGSLQEVEGVPDNILRVYKTGWDIDPLNVIDMAAGRAPYICQTQSLSFYMVKPTIASIMLEGGFEIGDKYYQTEI
ncbi:hypothetical protein D9611_008871 [Ephemerocybe angulata]|uniref:Ribonucleoside-diphosphate reductase n=1 Tax=Ephemerocybe angulata TaxID=980116 RepID=A0A8H5FCJ6_9AGAR|nr:hypothetical protein D9611_008871 [Tulosesus angulatus]